ncbi:hypothetical protein OY671_009530, partial [Metschnikowia pulcherrima]
MQVSEKGDSANWMIPGKMVKGMGGAMDSAIGAKDVFVMMESQTREGQSKSVDVCTYPSTGVRCVSRVYTDVAVFDIRADGVTVIDRFGETTADESSRSTGSPSKFSNCAFPRAPATPGPISWRHPSSDKLKADEKASAQQSQRDGKWKSSWRVVGRYANVSIFDVQDNDESHTSSSSSPSFP